MKKRIVALLLTCTLAVGTLLAGCGKQEEKQSDSSQKTQESVESQASQTTSTEEVEELEPYTVTIWLAGTESADDDMVVEAMNERIQEFLPNTSIEVSRFAFSEMTERTTKALAAGEKIDIVWSGYTNTPASLVNQDLVIPLDDLLPQYGQGIVDAVGGWDVVDAHRIKDKVYQLISWQGLVGGRRALMMNKELEKEMPDGWVEEFQQVILDNQEYSIEAKTAILTKWEEALKVAKDKGILTEGLLKGTVTDILWPGVELNQSYRVFVTEKDGVYTVQNWYDNPVYKACADIWHEFWKKGYIREDIVVVGALEPTMDNTFASTQDVTAEDYVELWNIKKGVDYTGIKLMPETTIVKGTSTGVCFPITGKNPERSMQVLNLIYTDAELYQLLIYGIEGTHYLANANGTITRPAKAERSYVGIDNWVIGTCLNGLAEDVAQVGHYELLLESQETAKMPALLNFSFSAKDNGVDTQLANFNALASEYDYMWYSDDYEARYAEFCKKMKEAGADEYLEAYKKALSEYVTANNLGTVAP